jgi:polyisoprenoid-binding protein YceI
MKIKSILIFMMMVASVRSATAQVWFTKTGVISIYSHTEVEDIKADNFEVVSFLDAAKGDLRFQLLVKGFQFPKAAMQQHFNSEAYMNSDQFPKSEFKGVIDNVSSVNFSKDGNYAVTVSGDLSMHGVTKKIKQAGTITIKGGKVSANTVFNVKRSDYNISVPKFNAAKIADDIQVTVKCDYIPYAK